LGLLAVGEVVTGDLDLPTFAEIRQGFRSSEGVLLDRHGVVLEERRIDPQGRRLVWTPLGEISPLVSRILLHAEDRRFYAHGGVDWRALAGAPFAPGVRGASTLTMQLAAQFTPSLRPQGARRDPLQKWRQIRAALALERHWHKEEILEAYLNLVSFRGEWVGIATASRGLFGKHPSGLDETEALLLVALLRAPNALAAQVAQRVCRLAAGMGIATACPILTERVRVALAHPALRREQAGIAPHVAQQLLQGRAQVVSTLDGEVQQAARETLIRHLGLLAGRGVHDGAVLIADNRSGEILAYVGNGGAASSARHVDGVRAPRQAGSTLKPFLYELALERRLVTAASPLEDAPLDLATPTGLYTPQNYDHGFKGWISVRSALASSLNVPAVRTTRLVGMDGFVERLRRLGFSGLTEEGDYYGPALALGAADVTLWQLVQAYRTLANGGRADPPLSLLPQRPLPLSSLAPLPTSSLPTSAPSASPTRILDADAAFVVADILADPLARSLTFGLDSQLSATSWSAVKTGTSKDMRDNWCVGFSDRYTVGVWVGNFNGEPMHDVSGVTGAAPVWRELMEHLHRHRPGAPPAPSPGVRAQEVRFEPGFEPPRREWFLAGTEQARIRLGVAPLRLARITYPAEGEIFALDPDIPSQRQRIFFAVSPRREGLSLRLDGQPWPSPTVGWEPDGGQHELALTDAQGRIVDRVAFSVRGAEHQRGTSAPGP
jgi:penicillin-binding protein 1C